MHCKTAQMFWMLACPYSDQFKCGSGECVYNVYQCDGRVHCKDGSDEICSLYSCLFAFISCCL